MENVSEMVLQEMVETVQVLFVDPKNPTDGLYTDKSFKTEVNVMNLPVGRTFVEGNNGDTYEVVATNYGKTYGMGTRMYAENKTQGGMKMFVLN